MDAKMKALIVLLVLVLSTGPLVYFFGQNKDNGNTGVTPLDQLPYVTLGVTMLGEITELNNEIIYNGISEYNNPGYIDSILNETMKLKNYSVTQELNKQGSGYAYHIKVPVESNWDLEKIGFTMTYNLQPFFTGSPDNLPIRMGKIKFPNTIDLQIDNETSKKISLENQTATLVALYWEKQGTGIQINCPKMRFNKEDYTYLKNLDMCYDATPTKGYGLTSTVLDSIAEKKTIDEFKVEIVTGAYYEMPERADLKIDDFIKAFPQYYSERNMYARNEGGKFKLDFEYVSENATVDYVLAQLKAMGLTPTYSFKEGTVVLPAQIKVGTETYSTRFRGMQHVKLKINTKTNDIVKFNIYTKAKYGQLLDLRLEEVGA